MDREPADARAQFTTVYRAEFGFVWKVLSRLGARPAEQEDLAHDVFATAYRQWANYDPSRPVRPWLFGIAYRVVLDFKRKGQNRQEAPTESIERRAEGNNAEESLAAAQGLALANRLLASVELDRRTVFVMHEIEEFSMPDVAQALDIPLNTAYSRLRLARRDFNALVAELQSSGRPS